MSEFVQVSRTPPVGTYAKSAGTGVADRCETLNGMTDHPRFEPVRGAPQEVHLMYNGGRLVDAVLRLIDWWLAARESVPPSARGHEGDVNKLPVH